jgi:peptidyl-prolyl cis-trans isomerase D
MAVLSKIRQRSFLVIAIVGLSLFAFILGALIKGDKLNQSSSNIGTINGVDIPFADFRNKVDEAQKSQQGMSIMQATNGVWEQEVRKVILSKQCEQLGLKIGKDQLINIIKEDPQFAQNPQFLNDAKKFDIKKFNEFIGSIKNSSPERWQQWLDYEKQLESSSNEELYYTMLKSGIVTTQSEAKFNYEIGNNKASIDFINVPYTSIDDKKVTVSDAEVIAYMEKNKKKFKADETRMLEFSFFENKPSVEDEKVINDKITSLLNSSVEFNKTTNKNDTVAGFKNTTDVIGFINKNSDIKYDSTYVNKSDLQKNLAADKVDALFNLAPGQIYGPYVYGKYSCLTRSLGKKSGSSAKASHILLSYVGAARSQATRTKAEALAKANEILAQAQANPSSFQMLAFTNSDDSSKQQGGDLGFFSKGQMTKKFEDFAFNNPVGKIGLIETEFGYHIITVTGKQDGIRLAVLAQKIEPSEATSNEIFTQASKFEVLANEKTFDAAAKQMKLKVDPAIKLAAIDENIPGVGPQREIVRWAFTSKVGEVKQFTVPSGYVVAKLKAINEAGLQPVEDAKTGVLPILRNEKKAVLIKAKMTGTTLDAIAKSTGTPAKQATDLSIQNPYLQAAGSSEPKVAGTAFTLKPGSVSDAIEGNGGVYKIKLNAITKAPAATNLQESISKNDSQNRSSVSGRVFATLKEDAKIEDNRAQFN